MVKHSYFLYTKYKNNIFKGTQKSLCTHPDANEKSGEVS